MSGNLLPGALIGGRYQILNYLGEGGMQYVYVARDNLTERNVALKTPKNKSATKRFRRSAVVAARVNHPNVAKTLDYIKENESRYLIEELIVGSDMKAALLDKAEYLDPYLVAKILHHLAKGVAAAHHAGVVHRDLKPTNIMICGQYSLTELKVTDFGIAKMASEELLQAVEGGEESLTTSQTAVGALPYMAPEAIETPRDVTEAADIWSIGAMTYHLLCGQYPYGQGLRAVPKIVEAAEPEIPSFVMRNPQFSPLATEIIEIMLSCLRKNPNDRPTADDLVRKCSQLCYSISDRTIGVVNNFMHSAYGFITTEQGNVFYHKDSVYGDLPNIGDKVVLASYDGGYAPRALPVLKLSKN
ncbi:serine/threonine-protein kinase [Pectobacterium parmentieri]|uniref:serine/threonine-protein kinase n=1 Tax=Pectobacterium parmentieri TaxID=1905730 RepID=UPI00051A5E19|nr:serine/threonine-protein kinase [Pectobacterium parmentieri]AOR59600.1 protein kinase [Pectobacterium parmentieri]QQK71511.1 protein kinase [Pectobacterium versatile]